MPAQNHHDPSSRAMSDTTTTTSRQEAQHPEVLRTPSNSSIPHLLTATFSSTHNCNTAQSTASLLPLDYRQPTRLPYPDNAPPSCNEIYDCDIVGAGGRRYNPTTDMAYEDDKANSKGSEKDATARETEDSGTSKNRRLRFLFYMPQGSPLDTVEKVMDIFCLDDNELEKKVVRMGVDSGRKNLDFVVVDGVEKSVIVNHVGWVKELDDFVPLFWEVPEGLMDVFCLGGQGG